MHQFPPSFAGTATKHHPLPKVNGRSLDAELPLSERVRDLAKGDRDDQETGLRGCVLRR